MKKQTRIIHNFASKTKAVKYIKWNKTKKILSVFSYPNCGLKMDPLTVARKHNKIPMASNAQKRLKQKILSAKLKNFASKVTVSWELWKHHDPAPGGRPMFFKAKVPKESKNGFKTISCCCYPVMFFSKNYFRHQKSSTFCWFLNCYVNIYG